MISVNAVQKRSMQKPSQVTTTQDSNQGRLADTVGLGFFFFFVIVGFEFGVFHF
jgi:hypothetical protein